MKDNTPLNTEELLIKKYFGKAFKHKVSYYRSEMTGELISTSLILKKNGTHLIEIFETENDLEHWKNIYKDKLPETMILLSKEEFEAFEKSVIREQQIDSILND